METGRPVPPCRRATCSILGGGRRREWGGLHPQPGSRAPRNPGEDLALAGEVRTSWMTVSVVASTYFVCLLILLSRTEPITPSFPAKKIFC